MLWFMVRVAAVALFVSKFRCLSTTARAHFHSLDSSNGTVSRLIFQHRVPAMKICTHSGCFHCDEALAVSLLRLLPEFRDAEVVRTRNSATIDACDVVVDVGGVYDPDRLRFDHHQTEFNDFFDDDHKVTRLSSAGLVYKHFAKRIFREAYSVTDASEVDELYRSVYDGFIEGVDAIDNGVPLSDGVLKYKVYTDLSSRVARLNPSWLDADVDPDERFREAMKLTLSEFDYFVGNMIRVCLSAKGKFQEAYSNRFAVHPSGLVIETPRSMPFYRYMYELEERESVPPESRLLFYVTFEKATDQWRCSCLKDSDRQFQCRLPFPPRLSGLRDDELQKASGIPDLTFIHRAGFTCGGKTKESVLRLISLTLAER